MNQNQVTNRGQEGLTAKQVESAADAIERTIGRSVRLAERTAHIVNQHSPRDPIGTYIGDDPAATMARVEGASSISIGNDYMSHYYLDRKPVLGMTPGVTARSYSHLDLDPDKTDPDLKVEVDVTRLEPIRGSGRTESVGVVRKHRTTPSSANEAPSVTINSQSASGLSGHSQGWSVSSATPKEAQLAPQATGTLEDLSVIRSTAARMIRDARRLRHQIEDEAHKASQEDKQPE